MEQSRIVVIIPVKNEEDKIIACLESIRENKSDITFIVVDDNSTDNTVNNVRNYFAENKDNVSGMLYINNDSTEQGAGACRNLGLQKIECEPKYILFFDADDTMPKGALDKLADIGDITDANVIIGKYDYLIHQNRSLVSGMTPTDEILWSRSLSKKENITFELSRHAHFIETVNYPWNKLLRYDFVKEIGLRFSNTPVHNDIFAHWQILMNSQLVTLVNQSICNHFVIQGNAQITNIGDERRLAIFQALQEVDDLIISTPEYLNNYYHFFLKFKKDVLMWAKGRIHNKEIKSRFESLFSDSYKNINKKILLVASEKMPNVASEAVFFKLGVKKL